MANGALTAEMADSLYGMSRGAIGHQLSAINYRGPIAQLVRAHP